MDGINRALKNQFARSIREILSEISTNEVPCIFISYQREDEEYAQEVAKYIISKQIDVYFDLEDKDLKLANQINDPQHVTDAIRKGLKQSNYMIVIVSPTTYKSPWVPFEVGYAYDEKGNKMKILRHKNISKSAIPGYLKVKELLQGTASLDRFLDSIRRANPIYENLAKKGERIKTFSMYSSNPLNRYLDNQ
jgi:hypothetical protein